MSSQSTNKTYFTVTYRNPKDDKILELNARKIQDSSLGLSFISVSDFVFPNSSSVVVDPEEEYLQKRFENVKSLHLSIYSIISIEEVGENSKGLKFEKDRSNLVILNQSSPSSEPPSH